MAGVFAADRGSSRHGESKNAPGGEVAFLRPDILIPGPRQPLRFSKSVMNPIRASTPASGMAL